MTFISFFLFIGISFAQLGGGVICEDNDTKCLENAPTTSIDGISKTELIPYYPLLILLLIIPIIIFYYKRKT